MCEWVGGFYKNKVSIFTLCKTTREILIWMSIFLFLGKC